MTIVATKSHLINDFLNLVLVIISVKEILSSDPGVHHVAIWILKLSIVEFLF